jgi:hypothetical protein
MHPASTQLCRDDAQFEEITSNTGKTALAQTKLKHSQRRCSRLGSVKTKTERQSLMKTLKRLLASAAVGAVMFLVGCGNNSSNQSNSTNSASGVPPSTNGMMNNNPAVGMTNSLATTNR